MRPLPISHGLAVEQAKQVRSWLDGQREQRIDAEVEKKRAPGSGILNVPIILALVSFVGSMGSCVGSCVVADHRAQVAVARAGWYGITSFREFWPTFGTIFLVVLGFSVIGVIATEIIQSAQTKRLRDAAREQLTAAFHQDPLVRRAALIVEAVDEYALRCRWYQSWCEEVERGLLNSDPEHEDRYHAALLEAERVFSGAITNFWRVIERTKRATALGAVPGANDASFTELIEELRAPIAPATLPDTVIDPARALEQEEQLTRIAAEIRQLRQDHS